MPHVISVAGPKGRSEKALMTVSPRAKLPLPSFKLSRTRALAAVALWCVVGAQSAKAATAYVVVSGITPGSADVYVSLCAGTLDPHSCGFSDRQTASATTMRFTFTDVPPGRYAVLAFEDVNGNGTLDRTRLGLPLEPFALSRDAGRRHSPTFEQAAIAVIEPAIEVRLALKRLAPKP